MTGRQVGWIFSVLALMLAGWLALRGRAAGPDAADGLDLGIQVGPDVSYVRIDPPDAGPIELERRADGWTVNGYPAVDSLVAATVAGLDTLRPGRLIARSAASHDRLGLTPEAAVRVRVGPAGRPDVEFLIGGIGTDGRFVRLPDAPSAYVLPSAVMDPLAGSETAWRDFTITRVDTAALRRVVIRRGDRIAADLSRSTGTAAWTVGGTPADTAVLRVYLETLTHLRATGFPADSFVYAADFEQPVAAVDLYAGDEGARVPDVSLLFSTGLDHPDVLVRRADDPVVYALDRSRANLLTTTAQELTGRR